MNRKLIFNILKIVVSVALLTFIYYQIDLQQFLTLIRQANRSWLLAALVAMFLGVVIRAWRWQVLLNALGDKVSLIKLTEIYFIGFLFNNLLPSGLGGDAIRMLELKPHTKHGSDTVTSVIVDRFLGLSALQAIALIGLLFDWEAVPVAFAYFTVAIFIAGVGGGLLLINRPLYLALQNRIPLFRRLTELKMIGNLFESFQRYPLAALGKSYAVSLLFNVVHIAMNVFIGWGLG
ncbi:MAG: lysylphosphatidylglycerol synthase transmembrane domain-containing protein, partial [Anaerolineae bacterium]|nr:lysylphosphatidylglycerol synthase transmembrane domain-containing protein [Anaerolineae bacterium]